MEVNLRSSESIGQAGTPGKSVTVDTTDGSDLLPDNPYRNVAHLTVNSGGPVTLYFCTNADRKALSGGGGAGQSIVLAAGSPPFELSRWNGPVSCIASAASSVGIVEYDLAQVATS